MNLYNQYKQKSIESMSPEELLVALFDRALRDLKYASIALEDEDWDKFEENLQHFSRIIRHLDDTLDRSQPISADLYRLYDFMQYDVGRLRAGRKRRKDELPALITIVQNLRDGFDGASKKAPNAVTAVDVVQKGVTA
jgi:flagellar protein FliS